MDKIWPKKANFQVGKQKPHNIIYFVNNEPCFIEPKDGPLVPHIKLLHKYPMILPTCQVDKGGIKHVISGANIMIPLDFSVLVVLLIAFKLSSWQDE